VCFTQIDVPVDTLNSAVVSTVLSALAESALPWLAKHRAAAVELVADEPELAEAESNTDTATAATAADAATDDTTAATGDDDSTTADTAAVAAAAVAKWQKHQQQLLDRAAECGAGAAQAALAVNTFRAASALLEAPAHAATFVNSNTSSSSSSGGSSGSSWLCELVRAAAAPSPNGSSLAQLDTLESSWRELWSRWHSDSQRWCSSDCDAPPAAAVETEVSDTAAAADTTAAAAATATAGSVARISSSRANAAAGSGSSGAGSTMAATLAAALDAERRAMSALDAAAGGARGSNISTSRSYYAQEDVSALLAEQQQQLQQQQSVSVSASSLSAYISATAAAMGAGTVVLDTSAAVAQLMEMGFEREWAEVALRYTMSPISQKGFTTSNNTIYKYCYAALDRQYAFDLVVVRLVQ
jgi:hypothetical protein